MAQSRREIKLRYIAKRKAAGLCLTCPGQARPGRFNCEACRIKGKEKDRSRASGVGSVPIDHPTTKMTGEQMVNAVERFRAGETIKSLAAEFGVTFTALAQNFRTRGVSVSRRGYKSRVANPTCFSDPFNNERAAYFIGLLMADGYVSEAGSVSIGLIATDRYVLDELNHFLGGGYQVKITTNGKSRGRYSDNPMASLSFRCKQTVSDLASFGFSPRKSATCKALRGLEHNKHFWRGMIDGDGSIFFDERDVPLFGLVGSEDTCNQFAEFIRFHRPTWRGNVSKPRHRFLRSLRLSGDHARAIANLLYNGASIAIERKAAAAAKAMLWQSQRPRRQ